MKKGARSIFILLLVWFFLALILGWSGWFGEVGPIGVAVTVWTLIVMALVAVFNSGSFRDWAGIVNVKWLIAPHLVRFVGLYFLVLANRGVLNPGFARPAGIGDLIVATSAVILLVAPRLRKTSGVLFAWNALGLLDILFVIASALRFGLRDPQSMLPLRILPLSLLPTFFVPLIVVSHMLIFVRRQKSALGHGQG